MGRHDEAGPPHDRALALCRELGWRYGESRILVQRANTLLDLGEYRGSRALHRQAVGILEQINDDEARATSLDALGLIAQYRGAPGEAADLYRQALELHRGMDNRRGQGYVLTHLGCLLAEQGAWDEAAEALEESLVLRRAMGSQGLLLDSLAGLALVALGQGQEDEARAYVEEVLAAINERGVTGVESPVQVYLAAYRVLAAAGEEGGAARVLEAGQALLAERAGQIQDEGLRRQFLEVVPFNRALLALGAS